MASDRSTETTPRKKSYTRPSLRPYGKLKDLTTGGTGHATEPSSSKKPRP